MYWTEQCKTTVKKILRQYFFWYSFRAHMVYPTSRELLHWMAAQYTSMYNHFCKKLNVFAQTIRKIQKQTFTIFGKSCAVVSFLMFGSLSGFVQEPSADGQICACCSCVSKHGGCVSSVLVPQQRSSPVPVPESWINQVEIKPRLEAGWARRHDASRWQALNHNNQNSSIIIQIADGGDSLRNDCCLRDLEGNLLTWVASSSSNQIDEMVMSKTSCDPSSALPFTKQ